MAPARTGSTSGGWGSRVVYEPHTIGTRRAPAVGTPPRRREASAVEEFPPGTTGSGDGGREGSRKDIAPVFFVPFWERGKRPIDVSLLEKDTYYRSPKQLYPHQ